MTRPGRPAQPHAQAVRLVRLLRLLESAPETGLDARELAFSFGVTLRTLHRDFLALAFAREPVERVRGRWRLGRVEVRAVTATATTEGEGR